MKKTALCILINIITFTWMAGQNAHSVSAGFDFNSGLNIPFYNSLDYITKDGVYAFDMHVEFKHDGTHHQDMAYNNPLTGLGYSYWSTGNDDILGNAHVLYSSFTYPFKSNDRSAFSVSISAGAAYLTKNFDPGENHLNRAIGSPMNIYMNLSANYNLLVTGRYNFRLHAGIMHLSNGKTRSPNYGINAAIIGAGLNYQIAIGKTVGTPLFSPSIPGNFIHSISMTGGSKVYDDLTGQRFLSATFSYNIERHINQVSKAGLGTDLFYDGSIESGLTSEGQADVPLKDLFRSGLHASYSLLYKRSVAGIQGGYYIYSKFTVLTNFYMKLFYSYSLSEKISAGVSLRSHYGKADALEFGITYTWN